MAGQAAIDVRIPSTILRYLTVAPLFGDFQVFKARLKAQARVALENSFREINK
jgi:hypothetical protein